MKGQTIPPDLYPQMLPPEQAARILEEAAVPLREALLGHVAGLEAAGNNPAQISAWAHEIKGFADTAGLPAAARIAEGLCRYLEESEIAGLAPDADVLALHVSAIGRAARDTGLNARMGEMVVSELAALAAHKLAAARNTAPNR